MDEQILQISSLSTPKTETKKLVFDKRKQKQYEKEIQLLLSEDNRQTILKMQKDNSDHAKIGKIIEMVLKTMQTVNALSIK